MASALQTQFGNQAAQYGQQYGQLQGQAQNAYNSLNDFSKNMLSGTDMYQQQLGLANQNAAYDPNQLRAAQSQVSQIQGILGGLPRAVQARNANYGATAGDVAGQFSTEAQNLNQTLGLANQNAANQIQNMQGGLAGAQAATTAGLQGQQNKLTALQQTYDAANKQADMARSQQQFYADLYAKQGYLDAQQAQAYAQAKAAEAQANLFAQQAAQTAQQVKFAQAQADQSAAAAAQGQKAAPSLGGFANTPAGKAGMPNLYNYTSPSVTPQYLGSLGNFANNVGSSIGRAVLGLL